MSGKNDRVKLTVWMSKELKKKLDAIIEKKGYQSYSEYVRSRIRDDFERLCEGVING